MADDAMHMSDAELDMDIDAPIPPENAPQDGKSDDGEHDDDDDDIADDNNGGSNGSGDGGPTADEARNLFGLLGGDLQQLGLFLSNASSRLKPLLANIKQRNDPTIRLLALQELSELLSMSNEDSLQSFSTDQFVSELVKVMGGSGKPTDSDDEDGDDDGEPKDPDAALAAALAAGDDEMMEDIPEAQLLACRCLANLMEAIPGSAHNIVYHGAIPVLCSKLIMIVDIDLAEQTLSVCISFSVFYHLFTRIYYPDIAKALRRIPRLDRTRRRPWSTLEYARFLPYWRAANCPSSSSQLLPQPRSR
jgi:E3 ubiquitin-protein ligase TRIP12